MVNAKGPVLRWAAEWAVILVIALVGTLLLRTFVFSPYVVPTGSMEPTIQIGDQVFAEKVSLELGQPVQVGDIVVFENPDASSEHEVLVKRVVATEGQTVDLRNGQLYIDGERVEDPYASGNSYPLTVQAPGMELSYPYTVPAGHVWMMGDNRENSADSRYFGPVPIENLEAKVLFRYWPLNRLGAID